MKVQKAELNVISSVSTMSFSFSFFLPLPPSPPPPPPKKKKNLQLLNLFALTDSGPGLVTTTMLWHATQPFSQLGPMNCQALSSWRERGFHHGSQHLAWEPRPDGYLMGIVAEQRVSSAQRWRAPAEMRADLWQGRRYFHRPCPSLAALRAPQTVTLGSWIFWTTNPIAPIHSEGSLRHHFDQGNTFPRCAVATFDSQLHTISSLLVQNIAWHPVTNGGEGGFCPRGIQKWANMQRCRWLQIVKFRVELSYDCLRTVVTMMEWYNKPGLPPIIALKFVRSLGLFWIRANRQKVLWRQVFSDSLILSPFNLYLNPCLLCWLCRATLRGKNNNNQLSRWEKESNSNTQVCFLLKELMVCL